jgi:hypothetical protein
MGMSAFHSNHAQTISLRHRYSLIVDNTVYLIFCLKYQTHGSSIRAAAELPFEVLIDSLNDLIITLSLFCKCGEIIQRQVFTSYQKFEMQECVVICCPCTSRVSFPYTWKSTQVIVATRALQKIIIKGRGRRNQGLQPRMNLHGDLHASNRHGYDQDPGCLLAGWRRVPHLEVRI